MSFLKRHKKWEKIYDKINFDAYYPFSVQNVKDFAKFCESVMVLRLVKRKYKSNFNMRW